MIKFSVLVFGTIFYFLCVEMIDKVLLKNNENVKVGDVKYS